MATDRMKIIEELEDTFLTDEFDIEKLNTLRLSELQRLSHRITGGMFTGNKEEVRNKIINERIENGFIR